MSLQCGIKCTRWVVFIGLFIPTFGEKPCSAGCSNVTVAWSLGSTAMLPCSFDQTSTAPVLWSKGEALVRITNPRQVAFLNHKMGRLVVFPNLSLRGNFSITLTQLEAQDMGDYCCERGHLCWRVHMKQAPTHQDGTSHTTEKSGVPEGIYIIIAATVILIGIIITCFCMLKNKWVCVARAEYAIEDRGTTPVNAQVAPSHPQAQRVIQRNPQGKGDSSANNQRGCHMGRHNNPQQQGRNIPTAHQGLTHYHSDLQRGAVPVHRGDSIVYENDDHDPGLQQRGALHAHSQTDDRFPQSQTSHVSQPNYANQSEISKTQQAKTAKAGQKRGQTFQLQNPIYGNSTEILNNIT